MFIVGENLRQLVNKHSIVDNLRDVEETCIELKLHHIVKRITPAKANRTLKYGERIPNAWIKDEDIKSKGLCIKPYEALLACSSQIVFIPQGYMGMIQTKGSLARLFVFIHFSDSQVDSGYRGRITFEMFNAATFNVLLHEGQKVANLYILPVSDKNVKPYKGKYNNADEPTIQLP